MPSHLKSTHTDQMASNLELLMIECTLQHSTTIMEHQTAQFSRMDMVTVRQATTKHPHTLKQIQIQIHIVL